MNDGNMWNREHHNEIPKFGNGEKRTSRTKPAKNAKKTANPQRKSPNSRNSNKPATSPVKVNSQEKLLQELVQQNHTMIGLLRGIKNALISGETHPEQSNSKPAPASKKQSKPVDKTAKKDADTVDVQDSSEVETPKKAGKTRKQFVMRFDDKEPLNLDLDEAVETINVVEKVVEKNSEVIDIATQNEDENSLGESNPFSFFDK